MDAGFTPVIRRHGEWRIGRVGAVPGVNSQGTTREELIDNSRDALEESLGTNRQDARATVVFGDSKPNGS